jgi:hypothetical protein
VTHRSNDRWNWCVFGLVVLSSSACQHVPAAVPDSTLLGCYRVITNLPSAYVDSLGYEVPKAIRLSITEYGQWTVIPTDPDWPPDWTPYDNLPSSLTRRQRDAPTGSPLMRPEQWESASRIPGDSIDVRFPSALGSLVMRIGRDGDELRGRAEWVVPYAEPYLNEGVFVQARPTSCSEVPLALKRR